MFMAEKGMEMFKQTVDLRSGENRQAEHLKRNPHGRMPTLGLDDGSYLSLRARRLPRPQDDRGEPPAMARRADRRQGILCGTRFSLADILLYCWVDFGGQVGQPLHPANANIAAWFARVGQRPSVKA